MLWKIIVLVKYDNMIKNANEGESLAIPCYFDVFVILFGMFLPLFWFTFHFMESICFVLHSKCLN